MGDDVRRIAARLPEGSMACLSVLWRVRCHKYEKEKSGEKNSHFITGIESPEGLRPLPFIPVT